MASPSTVITLGYGSFGSVNLVPTLGFGIGSTADPSGGFDVYWRHGLVADWRANPNLADWRAKDNKADWSAAR